MQNCIFLVICFSKLKNFGETEEIFYKTENFFPETEKFFHETEQNFPKLKITKFLGYLTNLPAAKKKA